VTTQFQTNEDAIRLRAWQQIDATDIPLGRLASQVASILRGKTKPTYAPHVDGGDFVIVTNADKVKLTGQKLTNKIYISHSGFVGGLKQKSAQRMLESKPERLIQMAVEGMLPSGPLGRRMALKLKIYTGDEHPHKAQKPEVLKLKYT